MSTAPAVQGKRILTELEVVKRNQDRQKGAAMTENTPNPLGNVIPIDDERIKRIFLIEVLVAARKATLPCEVIE